LPWSPATGFLTSPALPSADEDAPPNTEYVVPVNLRLPLASELTVIPPAPSSLYLV
jgi:hypothetical protein